MRTETHMNQLELEVTACCSGHEQQETRISKY